jgi:hypothetical protein
MTGDRVRAVLFGVNMSEFGAKEQQLGRIVSTKNWLQTAIENSSHRNSGPSLAIWMNDCDTENVEDRALGGASPTHQAAKH